MVGLWQGFYSSGKPNYSGEYKNGKKNGKWLYWFERNGKLREEATYVMGFKHGHWIQYTENGFTDSEGKYRRGKQTGTWKYYYETGGTQREQHFKNGHLTGKSTIWQPNQKLQCTMSYTIIKDSRKGHEQSVPDGTWIFYDKNGVEINRITYRRGARTP